MGDKQIKKLGGKIYIILQNYHYRIDEKGEPADYIYHHRSFGRNYFRVYIK
jgi:hypothetical protein